MNVLDVLTQSASQMEEYVKHQKTLRKIRSDVQLPFFTNELGTLTKFVPCKNGKDRPGRRSANLFTNEQYTLVEDHKLTELHA